MKKLLTAPFIVLLLWACGAPEVSESNGNGDLESLRQRLSEKQEAAQLLTKEIEELQIKISKLDTTDKVRRLVTVDTIRTGDFKHFVDIQAVIQSDDVVNISSDIPGRIIRLFIREGQQVSRGQLVAKIDMESTEKQLEELQTALDLATTVYERQSRLWEQNIGSEIQYLEARNNKERLEKSIASIRTQLAKANVYAPTSGVVEVLNIKEGEFANPGMPVGTIVNLNRLKVVADVPENYVGKIRKGEKVRIIFPTLGEDLEATVSMIGKTISPSNRTFKVEANLPGGKREFFKPNMLALMKISDYEEKNAISIPQEIAQQEASGKHFVLLKKQDEQGAYASKVYVTLGKSYDNSILVQEGLKQGDVVIIQGARGLANNELIEVLSNGDQNENETTGDNLEAKN
jgi:membrane fusion protein, multidrug efflux system